MTFLGGWPSEKKAAWEGLTQTQQDIAWFISQALTNQQIARRLFLSHHTVNYHLRQIFRKLGVSSRVELARIVQQQTGGRRDASLAGVYAVAPADSGAMPAVEPGPVDAGSESDFSLDYKSATRLDTWLQVANADLAAALAEEFDLDEVFARVERRAISESSPADQEGSAAGPPQNDREPFEEGGTEI